MSVSADIYNQVKNVMDKYKIPESIWLPIMQQESGGNPKSTTITPKEYSIGLFQINSLVHPQYRGVDLFNPSVNAEVAAKDFILPGYTKAKEISNDPKTQALITYSGLKDPYKTSDITSNDYIQGGIKPAWNDALLNSFSAKYDTASKGYSYGDKLKAVEAMEQGIAVKDLYGLDSELNDPIQNAKEAAEGPQVSLDWKQNIVKILFIILIIAVMVVSGFMMLKDNAMGELKKGLMKNA